VTSFESQSKGVNPSLTDRHSHRSSWIRNALLSLFLVLATAALYSPARNQPFSSYDDPAYVTSNAHLKYGLDWDAIKWAFTTSLPEWHPLTWLSHGLDNHLFYLNPARHHEMNLLFHTLNALLVFWVLVRATGYAGRSFMVAALFALHPINVESVAWIAERKNLLSMFFLLLALGAYGWYARKPRADRYLVVALLYALGLMAKSQIITFPCLLLLWDYWPLRRMFASSEVSACGTAAGTVLFPAKTFPWLLWEKVPLFALSAADAAFTMHAHRASGALNPLVSYTLSTRLQNAVISYARYIGKTLWPSRLTILYPYTPSSIRGWQVFASLILLAVVSTLVIKWRHRRYLLVGWFWFLGALLPMIGIVFITDQAMADRYAYLPFLGLFIMICWGVADWRRDRRLAPEWMIVPSFAVLLALVVVAHRQLTYWNSDVDLWAHSVAVTSNNWVAEDNLGVALSERGQLDDALTHYRVAAAIFPLHPITYLYIGSYYQQRGNPQAALEQYHKVLILSDNAIAQYARLRLMALVSMAGIYRDLGDNTRAAECIDAARRLPAH
jgi:protein O-mannosyl-transferase